MVRGARAGAESSIIGRRTSMISTSPSPHVSRHLASTRSIGSYNQTRFLRVPPPHSRARVMTSTARADELRSILRDRDETYERETHVRSSLSAINADAEWRALYDELKTLELELAGTPRRGFCLAYVKRKRRYCAYRARDGGTMCTLHRDLEESGDGGGDGGGGGGGGDADGAAAVCQAIERTTLASEGEATSTTLVNVTSGKKKNINRRMKKMTNPLAAPYQTPKTLDEAHWARVFGGSDALKRPLLVDIGTAKGGFIKALARERADACTRAKSIEYNLVGVEIYEPLVIAANAWVQTNRGSLKRRAHFVHCNANVSLKSLNLPNIRAICVQFPDPWSRARHVERRVMTPDFARAIADVLPSGGELYCCSDVRALAEEMYDVVAANDDFKLDEVTYKRIGEMAEPSESMPLENVPELDEAHKYEWKSLSDIKSEENVQPSSKRRWLRANPYDAHTERDIVCEGKIRPVYRFAVIRA